MSMPQIPEPVAKWFEGWSLAHFALDGFLTMLGTFAISLVWDLALWQAIVLLFLLAGTITSAIALWFQRDRNTFDFQAAQHRDEGYELFRRSQTVAHAIEMADFHRGICPIDLTHQDHAKLFITWREGVASHLAAVANDDIVKRFQIEAADPNQPHKAQAYLFGLARSFNKSDLRQPHRP